MTDELFNRIIKRLLSNADDAIKDLKSNPKDEFADGVSYTYYEVLDTIKHDLEIAEYDLKQCGLDIDLDKKYL